MKVELVDLEEFSGNKAHIYSVLLDDAEDTLFDQFVEENGPLYPTSNPQLRAYMIQKRK